MGRVDSDEDGLCSLVYNGRLDRLNAVVAKAASDKAGSSDDRVPSALLVNLYGAAGVTPIMLAAYAGNTNALQRLLELSADPEQRSSVTPAAHNDELFRRHSSTGPGGSSDSLQSAAQRLLQNGSSSSSDGVRGSMLAGPFRPQLWAAYFPRYSPVKGLRAAEFAVLGGQPAALELLIELGAADPADRVIEQAWRDDEGRRRELRAAVERGRQRREERRRRLRAQFPLETRLGERIVGQRHAIGVVSSAIRRKENGWVDSDSPLVMLFLGSSGIGKTETAKLVARYLFGDDVTSKDHHHNNSKSDQRRSASPPAQHPVSPASGRQTPIQQQQSGDGTPTSWTDCFIRCDMTEYQMKHEVSKFVGAPPGFVGYEEGGQLVKALTKCPNAVVLLDEVEKAHPDVLTVLLQAFDEGRLTDGQGQTVDCRDAIFIMTSNLAQREIADEAVRLREAVVRSQQQQEQHERAPTKNAAAQQPATITTVDGLTKTFKRNVVQPLLRAHFRRDEFLGRINEIIFFLPFTQQEQVALAEKELQAWAKRAQQRQNVKITWSPRVAALAATGYDLRYGARSVKYEIDRVAIAPIARAQEEGRFTKGATLHLDVASASDAAAAAESSANTPKKPALEATATLQTLLDDVDMDDELAPQRDANSFVVVNVVHPGFGKGDSAPSSTSGSGLLGVLGSFLGGSKSSEQPSE